MRGNVWSAEVVRRWNKTKRQRTTFGYGKLRATEIGCRSCVTQYFFEWSFEATCQHTHVVWPWILAIDSFLDSLEDPSKRRGLARVSGQGFWQSNLS